MISSSGKSGCIDYRSSLPKEIMDFIADRIRDFFTKPDVIFAGREHPDFSGAEHFRKKDIVLGYIPTAALSPDGEDIHIRMLEGDITVTPDPDIYLMVGLIGEVYPIKREKFEKKYVVCEGTPDVSAYYYPPSARIGQNKTGRQLADCLRGCKASGNSEILAVKLNNLQSSILSGIRSIICTAPSGIIWHILRMMRTISISYVEISLH